MTMSIKAHIEAGHYERDEKGRALVPRRDGGTLIVCATDRPGANPIVGYSINTPETYCLAYYPDSEALLPPPPRKREVKAWVNIYDKGTGSVFHHTRDDAERCAARDRIACVELTGSYTEEW